MRESLGEATPAGLLLHSQLPLSNLHPFIYVRVQSPSYALLNGQLQQGGRVSGLYSTLLGFRGTSLYSRGLEGGVLILLDISRVPSVAPPLQYYSPPFYSREFSSSLCNSLCSNSSKILHNIYGIDAYVLNALITDLQAEVVHYSYGQSYRNVS
ncbi:hypothetical protein AVEN_11559-1 [Araneus ventricosus]|uniref:Uncharacterized protein n=1 Tax=Araneus ventricosus TaxID=182803 RepID=A0A4Y2EYK7_ARAVE|nr:hypothetical protein AVEN_11559-1 [Araneus ventricosus]